MTILMRLGGPILGAAVFTAATTSLAIGAEPALFGVTVGKPLSLPHCADDPMIKASAGAMCWWGKNGSEQPDGDLDISFGPSYPKYLYSNLLMVKVSGGVVTRVAVTTDGIEVQKLIADLLRQKFGAPSTNRVRQLQNGFGARYSVLSQRWVLKLGADLRFEGTLDDIERGSIILRGPAEIKSDSDAAKGALGRPL